MEVSDKPAADASENIEKVRELLFGSEIKKRDKDLETLKSEFNNKLNEFKKQMDAQIESLKNLITRQHDELKNSIQKIESSSDEKYILTGKKISEANDRNLKTFESISKTQNSALDQLEKTLYSEIEKLSNDTQRDISILREIKLNRNTLGKLLQETAEKISVKK